MIKKKNLWFLTLFSLILVLSIYYITMPNELLITNNDSIIKNSDVNKNEDNDKKVDIMESDIISALKVEDNNNVLNNINSLKEKLTSKDISTEEKNLVFEDVYAFLKKLKEHNHRIYMLSYCKDSLQYQTAKISGSGLADFFDAIYITSIPKYELDINYSDGIFIDDNPSDILGLYSKSPKEVIRLRRSENKYSLKDIENNNIKEYSDFNEVPVN